jgi:hypothetical protein
MSGAARMKALAGKSFAFLYQHDQRRKPRLAAIPGPKPNSELAPARTTQLTVISFEQYIQTTSPDLCCACALGRQSLAQQNLAIAQGFARFHLSAVSQSRARYDGSVFVFFVGNEKTLPFHFRMGGLKMEDIGARCPKRRSAAFTKHSRSTNGGKIV